MSFLSRFSSLISDKRVAPVVHPVKAVPVVVKVDDTQVKELIIAAKDQAFQIKRRAEEEAQQILRKAQKTLVDLDHRLHRGAQP